MVCMVQDLTQSQAVIQSHACPLFLPPPAAHLESHPVSLSPQQLSQAWTHVPTLAFHLAWAPGISPTCLPLIFSVPQPGWAQGGQQGWGKSGVVEPCVVMSLCEPIQPAVVPGGRCHYSQHMDEHTEAPTRSMTRPRSLTHQEAALFSLHQAS